MVRPPSPCSDPPGQKAAKGSRGVTPQADELYRKDAHRPAQPTEGHLGSSALHSAIGCGPSGSYLSRGVWARVSGREGAAGSPQSSEIRRSPGAADYCLLLFTKSTGTQIGQIDGAGSIAAPGRLSGPSKPAAGAAREPRSV
ncbi:hypothetical protein NDU88_004165 [Pleurodeles waltl]|uniref:Uncharacterized protein n=1 Tax=Pleurodeles waltl TaxID=8319 RepID=A0AAV7V3M9_PLEWA|nr:hypothetical protein NDU88_004165 [Pleurodeles waltl]